MANESPTPTNGIGWRITREITVGDLVVLLGILGVALNLKFQVAEHEKRITAVETAQTAQASELAQHDTAIAVLRVKIGDGQNNNKP